MADQIKLISMRAFWQRIFLLVPVALAAVGVWYAVRWGMGNTMAEFAPNLEVARAAARFAPDDPQTHYTQAVLSRKSLLPEELPKALQQYEQAVSLSPNDYRLWMELGRVREQAGNPVGGEQALRRAVELAPSYAYPRWFLGNLLLRQGRFDEAFAELRRAGEADPLVIRPQVFNMAWSVYGKDVPSVLAAVGSSVSARAQFVEYLIKQNRIDDALRLWKNLGAEERREQRWVGEILMANLFSAKRFHAVLDVQNDIAGETEPQFSVGGLLNGSFEQDIGTPGQSFFGWQVVPVTHTQIHLDPRERHGGARSLRIIFNAPVPLDFRNVSQFIVVESSARYRLTYYMRTEDLKSGSTLVTEIVDAADPNRVLAASAPLPNGKNDWQPVTLEFTTSPQTEAITLRLNRAPCPAAECPIFGKVWYDDFDFQRIGGAGARSPGAAGGGTKG